MRLIDADFLKEWVDEYLSVFKKYDKGTIKGFVDHAPTIEPKRGEWIWDNDAVDWNLGAWICSNCHARNDNIPHSEKIIPLRWSGSKYCPNCGASMREREGE